MPRKETGPVAIQACMHGFSICSNYEYQSGLPDENFNKKPNNAEKRPEKGQTDCLKARKKTNFICCIANPLSQKLLLYKNIKKNFSEIKIKSFLALY